MLLPKIVKKIVVILLAIFIPIAGFYIGIFYGEIESTGRFVQWRSLGSPPGKVSKLLGIMYDSVLYVETVNGEKYKTTYFCEKSSPSCWNEANDTDKIGMPVYEACSRRWKDFIVATPPDAVVQSIQKETCGGPVHEQINYVLVQDGSVWSWEYSFCDECPIIWYFIYGPRGFGIGIVVSMVITAILWNKLVERS